MNTMKDIILVCIYTLLIVYGARIWFWLDNDPNNINKTREIVGKMKIFFCIFLLYIIVNIFL